MSHIENYWDQPETPDPHGVETLIPAYEDDEIEATEDPAAEARDEFLDRMLRDAGGALSIFTMYVGDRLGLYRVLAEDGAVTSGQLAYRTGTHERYIREWLEQQTVSGVLKVEDDQLPAEKRRYFLPAGHDEVLTVDESLNYLAPLTQVIAGVVRPLPQLLEAFRTGAGVPYSEYGVEFVEGQGRMNRAMFLHEYAQKWVPGVPGLQARLRGSGARVADVGCGVGWSSIGLAQAFPRVQIDGFDLDAPSISMARAHLGEAAVGDPSLRSRVQFQVRDAGDSELAGSYDLVTAFECVHDMSDPVSALRTMRRLVRPGGTVLIGDERVGERFSASGTGVEWMMYGWSVLHCLPVGMDGEHSACTGTVMRPDTLRAYAQEAGFRDIEVLPIDNFFLQFYRLIV